MREGDLVRACLQLLTARGWLAWRNQSGMIRGAHKGKAWAVRMGLPGMPDILAVKGVATTDGIHTAGPLIRRTVVLGVECKRGNAPVTRIQQAAHFKLRMHDVTVLTIRDIRELADALA